MQVAAVIVSVQVLGQTSLHFQLSIAQILVSIFTCAAIEVAITLWRRQALIWPASALLTGNGIALLLRVNGTRHGDWWSMHGAGYFVLAGALSLGSKYLIRRGDHHLFNPSNFGLVALLLALGTRVVNPQDLWWGPMSPGLVLALVLIVPGGVAVAARLRLVGLVAAFWATFAAGAGFVTAGGHCITARWSLEPVCGGSFWSVLALSPEILVFMFFMITDPKTIPSGRVARVCYGAVLGFLAALAAAPATTEFWTKTGVLAALIVVCAGRPLLERALPSPGHPLDDLGAWLRSVAAKARGVPVVAAGVLVPLLAVALLALAALPSRTAAAAGDAEAAAAAGEAEAAAAAAGASPKTAVAVAPPPVPRVTIGASVTSFKTAITPAQAQRMAGDLADDLAVEAQAYQTQDAALAASADTGAWLATVTGRIGTAQPPTAYTLSRLTLQLTGNPSRPQNPPTIEFDAVGTVAAGAADPTPFATTFSLSSSGGAYLISAESPPVGR